MDANGKGEALLEKFWNWRMENNPEFATICGFHDFDDKLEIYTIEAIKKRQSDCRTFLTEALQIISQPRLKKEMKDNLEFLVTELKTYITGVDGKGYFFPLNIMEGPQLEFQRLIQTMPYNSLEDYNKLLNRYKEFPLQMSQIIDLMREGIKQKMTFHKVSVAKLPACLEKLDQLDVLQKRPQDCVFYEPFTRIPDSITEEKKTSLLLEAVESISHNVLPAFKMLKEFLEKEYLKHTRPEVGVSCLPNGLEFYQMCLDFHLTLRMTPEEVHKIGLQEVERISLEMEKVIESMDLKKKMSVKDFSEMLRKDEKLFFQDSEGLLDGYRDLVFNKLYPLMPKLVTDVPKSLLKIEANPANISQAPAAFYLAGNAERTRPGIFYVNTVDVKSAPKYEMMTLALHETVPGHHLQASFLLEIENLPALLKNVEDRKYSEVPSRFPLHTAYMEGWGLYSEYLGYELGMYDDPMFHYGHLSHEMLRAVRLVVDTGMHAFGWTEEKATKYMLDHTATCRARAENEIKRYITWPGQACAYKIGELKIKALRKMAEKALGPKFSVQDFHTAVLSHFGPLETLERNITEFIKINA